MLTIQQIIGEADVLVPNAYTTADKIPWLNALNQEFFDVVKIPATDYFTTVSGTKTYTLAGAPSINLFNKDMVTTGFYVQYGNGALGPAPGYAASDYIPLSPNTTYTKNEPQQLAFYDGEKSYISGLATATIFTTPANCAYARITVINLDTLHLVAGSVPTRIKEKEIDKVMAGYLKYKSLNYEDVQPGDQWFTFADINRILTLSSAPSRSGIAGIIRYHKTATTTFTAADVATQSPDAPVEHHWIYSLGLAEYIAKANEEDEKASNYGGQYRNALQVAAQNYQKAGAT